jgi:hypothetical protein
MIASSRPEWEGRLLQWDMNQGDLRLGPTAGRLPGRRTESYDGLSFSGGHELFCQILRETLDYARRGGY